MKDGIYTDITIEAYHKESEYMSASSLKYIKKSPKHFDFYRKGFFNTGRKDYFDLGNAFELALLDQVEFDAKVVNEKDIFNEIMSSNHEIKTVRATSKYKEWLDNAHKSKKYVVSESDFNKIEWMLLACKQDAIINKLITGIEYQSSIFWTDKVTGLKLKTRPDICKTKKNIIVDVKTTVDGSPEAFSKALANYDYPFQACMQIDGVLQSGYMPKVDNYFWLVVEKEAPFSATIYEFDQSDIKEAWNYYEYYKQLTKMSLDSKLYPSYSQRSDNKFGILTAKIPVWYYGQ